MREMPNFAGPEIQDERSIKKLMTENENELNVVAGENEVVAIAEPVAEPIKKAAAAPSSNNDDDFDWEEGDNYSPAEQSRLEKLYESTIHELKENEVVKGQVVAISDKEVVLNIGFKSEGIVSLTEFRDMPDLKAGDEVEVYLETVEDSNGQLILSRKRAKHLITWSKILKAETEDVILEGLIKRRTKGGFVVDIDGIEAFLPGSQIDVKPVRDFDVYVGKRMDFKVVKINHPFENVVISHKILIEKDLDAQRQEILKNLEKGQVLEGTVKNMTTFGVFIDLGGVDGLLHITDISWGRINSPEEVLKLDEKINVVVLDFDEEKKRISLGLKQLQPHPWENLPFPLEQNARVKGKVTTITDYGIFIEIAPSVEGLVHLSEMSWSQHLKDPKELFKIGDEVDAVILSIDREERKISLGIKQTKEDPWTSAATKYPVNSKHKGTVRSMTSYGIFIELEEGIDGLLHISDFSWTKKFNHPNEFTKAGEEIEVLVLDVDVENRRLSLGHKQLTENLWDTFESIFVVGSDHEGTLNTLDDKGAQIELEYGIEGYAYKSHLDAAEDAEPLAIGSKVLFKVIEFNKDSKRLLLSHTLTWKEEVQEERSAGKGKKTKKTTVKAPKMEASTLGDLDSLQALKQQMEASEKGGKPAKKKAEAKTPVAEVTETPVAEVTEAPVAEVTEAPKAEAIETPNVEAVEKTTETTEGDEA